MQPKEIMNKDQAIKWIKEIQNGNFDRNEIVSKIPRGSIAVSNWDEPLFTHGLEYGVIIGLMKVFNIDKNEI